MYCCILPDFVDSRPVMNHDAIRNGRLEIGMPHIATVAMPGPRTQPKAELADACTETFCDWVTRDTTYCGTAVFTYGDTRTHSAAGLHAT